MNINVLEELKENPQVMGDDLLLEKLSFLRDYKKELEIIEKTMVQEIELRTDKRDTDFSKYNVSYKSSKLFDKGKAKDYIFESDLQDKFIVEDLDYKRVQSYLKSMENYEEFTKSSNSRLVIKRR